MFLGETLWPQSEEKSSRVDSWVKHAQSEEKSSRVGSWVKHINCNRMLALNFFNRSSTSLARIEL